MPESDYMDQHPADTNAPSHQWMKYAAAGMVVLYSILAWIQRAPAVTTRNDDALYILLARSLQAGHYHQPFLVGAPPHLHYPPAFPGLLAVLSGVFGESLPLFAAANIALVAVSLLLIADIVRRKWSPGLALLVLALGAINPGLHNAGARILSEALYLFLTAAALWAVTVFPQSRRWAVMAGVAAVIAGLTRSVGVTVIAALVVHWMFERKWQRAVVLAAIGGLTVGSWVWRASGAGQTVSRTYLTEVVGPVTGPLRSLGQRVSHHVVDYLTANIPSEMPVATLPGTIIDNLLWLGLLLVLSALGMWMIWRRWRVLFWYLAAYGGLLLLWRWVDVRYLIPLTPLLHLMVVAGWVAPLSRRWQLAARAAIVAYVIGVVAGSWQQGGELIERRLACDRAEPLVSQTCFNSDQRSLFAGAIFVRDSLPAEAVVISPKEATFAYYSERVVLHPGAVMREADDQFLDRALERGASHVFLDRIHPTSRRRIGRMLAPSCSRLDLVRHFPPKSYLFHIRAEPASPPTDGGSLPSCQALESFNAETSPDPLMPGWW